jgi:hypothetical protein
MVVERRKQFRFVTMQAFNRLPRGEKVAYLEGAAAEIKKSGDAIERSLFEDGPPILNPSLEKPA